LHSRILEELKDQRCCLWRAVLTTDELLAAGAGHYASMWHKYQQDWERAFRKAGTTHIAWVADSALSNRAVANIESDLIETLNPSANVSRPVPPVSLQEHTHEVIRHFRREIHADRGRKYKLAVKSAV